MNQNYLRQLLQDWGDWVDRAALHTGYPTESSICSAKEEIRSHTAMRWALPGGGSYRYALPSRHAILCYDMPRRLVEVHQAILHLGDEPRGALTLWYAYALRQDGTLWTLWDRRDKAAWIGLEYDTLERRVSRARGEVGKVIDRGVASLSENMLQSISMD